MRRKERSLTNSKSADQFGRHKSIIQKSSDIARFASLRLVLAWGAQGAAVGILGNFTMANSICSGSFIRCSFAAHWGCVFAIFESYDRHSPGFAYSVRDHEASDRMPQPRGRHLGTIKVGRLARHLRSLCQMSFERQG